jgi:hypothetical protein
MKKQSLLVVSASALSLVALAALANKTFLVSAYGAEEALVDSEYTLEEMLTYAIQDEYLAQAEYAAIMEEYGQVSPFNNIIKAEESHISSLVVLFDDYDFAVPINDASDRVVLPDALEDSYGIGIEAEILNIEMYEKFLEQDLPDDVRVVFEELLAGSENHLKAFENKANSNQQN